MDGYRNECKKCQNKRTLRWKRDNVEKVKASAIRYAKENPEKIRENGRKNSLNFYHNNKEKCKSRHEGWIEKNPNYYKEYNKKYIQDNSEKVNNKNEKWRNANPEKVKEIQRRSGKKYRENNLEKLRERGRIYARNNKKKTNAHRRERRKSDFKYKITCILRARMWNALKGNTKSATTKELLGCSTGHLKLYLEKQFTKEMSWDNYGSYWQIDHMLPCASFDMSLEEEQRKCFHYTNLQPLTCQENREKRDKIIIYN